MDTTLGIYTHIPFCLKKCPYCDFNSISLHPIPEDIYIDAVLLEFNLLIERHNLISRQLETIYIGGGTPTLLSPDGVKRLLNGLSAGFSTVEDMEITIEANPGTVDLSRLQGFKAAGVNRLSIGVQSFNDKTLKTLGRIHNARAGLKAFEDARGAGFENIGIDLIFGVPGRKGGDWQRDIEMAISLRPEHISIYNLTIEEGTPFYTMAQEGRLTFPSDDEEIEMYGTAIHLLKEAGYRQYEISNFSLPGYESTHNQRYWLCKDYIGLGAGAHSYLGTDLKSVPSSGVRWWNEKDLFKYMDRIRRHGDAVTGKEFLTMKEAMVEGVFLGLRRLEGLDKERFLSHFGSPLKDLYHETIERLKENNLIFEEGRFIKLTHKGVLLSNEVFAELFSP
ncbi:MAG: radical SAM family heme chaperone HemW [Deltaproteobacteria bacterium]|nr:radical SAM family heme chaperone HemW [Deltaproteobacteria bacterium]